LGVSRPRRNRDHRHIEGGAELSVTEGTNRAWIILLANQGCEIQSTLLVFENKLCLCKNSDELHDLGRGQMYGIHPQRLRLYEREGLIKPSGTASRIGNRMIMVLARWLK
jgi:hypothetical protein